MNTKIQHLRSFLVVYFCCSLITPVWGAENQKNAPVAEELLFFRHEGGYSPYKFVEVLIRNDGSGVATFERMNKENGKIPFQLDTDELETLKTLVLATDFFSQHTQDTRRIIDAGTCTLRISMNGEQHEIHFQQPYSPIGPLTTFVWGLVHQGIAISDLEEQKDAHLALRKVSGHLAKWAKVIQPEALRKPLKKFVHKSEDHQQLLWAIEALSWVTTPEEWMGFLSKELNSSKKSRKNFLLKALSSRSSYLSIGDIPRSHREILAPLFLRYLRLAHRNWSQFSKEKRQAYGSVIRFMGEQRYAISTPILVEMIRESYTDSASWLGWSLPHMAGEAIDPLKLLLDDPDASVRAPAAEMLGKILIMDPSPQNNTITEKERKRILICLKNTVAPKLEKLSKDDPDNWVRKAAKQSLQQIGRGWNK